MNESLKLFPIIVFSIFSKLNMSTESSTPLSVPSVDADTKKVANEQDVNFFFQIFDSCVQSGAAKVNSSESKLTIFTVEDQTFATSRPMDTVDPLIGDPETQRILLGAQVSLGKVDKDDAKISGDGLKVAMLNGKEITVSKKDGKLMANEMPVSKVFATENATIFVMEYFLFFTSDDISAGINRIHKKEGVVHTPWGSHPYVEKEDS